MGLFYKRDYMGLLYMRNYRDCSTSETTCEFLNPRIHRLFYIRDYIGLFNIRDYMGLFYNRDYMRQFYIIDYIGMS